MITIDQGQRGMETFEGQGYLYSNDNQRPRMKIETVEGLRYNDYQRLRMKTETIEGQRYNNYQRQG